jgi:hypothetical protein
MAGGLFLWASTVCDYLARAIRPDKQLAALLESLDTSRLPPTMKMDELYSRILASCPWDDDDFVEGYNMVVGMIVVAKTPLTTVSLQALLNTDADISVEVILKPLASLFTGASSSLQPVRVLHLSFRDFITLRAKDIQGSERYFVAEQQHHQRVAYRCLRVLDAMLSVEIPGLGYLRQSIAPDSKPGPPEPAKSEITEAEWYAVDCWPGHMIQIQGNVESEFVVALLNFLKCHIISWMEISAPRRAELLLLQFREWLQVHLHGIQA